MGGREPTTGRRGSPAALQDPMIVGTMILVLALVGIVISYRANQGLPFVPSYEVRAAVPDAAELTVNGSEVRVGGARVGVVTGVEAMPPRGRTPAYAIVTMALETREERLPVDTRVTVRPRSILGAKYVDLRRGHARSGVPPGGLLPLSDARPVVELDEAFDVFDDATSRRVRSVVTDLGDGLAGRGADVNATLAAARRATAPLERVARAAVVPAAPLRRLVGGVASATAALAPAAPLLPGLLAAGGRTLGAVDAAAPATAQTLDALAPTEDALRVALTRARPVLADAAAIARGLRTATPLLRPVLARGRDALVAGTPVLRRVPSLADGFGRALDALRAAARDPAAAGSLRLLTATVRAVGGILSAWLPAQRHCNLMGVSFGNTTSALIGGGPDATELNGTIIVGEAGQDHPSAHVAERLHVNPVPHENDAECEAGNEPFAKGLAIGNPPGLQNGPVERTAPPPGVLERGRAAGFVP
ncbi:MlaD family protein [Paraconexibacter antarcticus]|uniref:MlaD family protein n=1 Tax=Paraconexibacter antarcticus TaxID=2949664 RepID=A0ABY5DVS2_9ACTN|nr:MlaD family protein [Paraconexibacter antarcticus]UTI65398.1 MlaD family protein [Paraconexibacter antarcticus]